MSKALSGISAPPYFLAAGLSFGAIEDKLRFGVQALTAALHLFFWIFVVFTELYDLDNDDSNYKDGKNVNQLQSASFTASAVAFGLVIGAFVAHLGAKWMGLPGYSEGAELLPSGVTGLINGFLSASILMNTLLFIYIFVDVDRMLHYNEHGPTVTYTGKAFTHDNKADMTMTIAFKILLLAILKANQAYQSASTKAVAANEGALLGGK
tara:strand:- start:425 stop:1051 length:627 start_codon:yes stop_codon:yes gene_type:complete